VRAFRQAVAAGSPRVEIFLRRHGEVAPVLIRPRAAAPDSGAARAWLAQYLDAAGPRLAGVDTMAALVRAFADAPADVKKHLRISRHFDTWIDRQRRRLSRETERAGFLSEARADPAVFNVTRLPLLPYQREGMMHLAFGERALLADEIGLGKTIQAIAACELLARRKGIERVLVVCPASLKAEWEDQIARFTDRAARPVFGPRAERLVAYASPPFVPIVNYEQVLIDADAINETLRPDIVVLDEAQRIKNWHTKTAGKIKSLRSPYALVLTGTPIENRIDERYSIVQFLDPELVGPLFRFNRSFYELDARGRPMEYRNLEELQRRVAPVLLRRRKSDVESELPGRTVKTYFVPMADEQKARYGRRGRLAHRLGPAGSPTRRDQPVQAGCGLPPVPFDRQRQCWSQPSGRQRGDQSRSALEPRQTRATDRPRLAQEPDPFGERDQSGHRTNIEHAMLGLLGAKQALADGLLDGLGAIGELKMPSGKGSLVDRMRMMLEKADALGPRIVPPQEAATAALRQRHGDLVVRVEEFKSSGAGGLRLLVVLDTEPEAASAEAERLGRRPAAAALPIEVVDRGAWLAIQRLAASGMLSLGDGTRRILHASPEMPDEAAR
jgi:hypothetical protein